MAQKVRCDDSMIASEGADEVAKRVGRIADAMDQEDCRATALEHEGSPIAVNGSKRHHNSEFQIAGTQPKTIAPWAVAFDVRKTSKKRRRNAVAVH